MSCSVRGMADSVDAGSLAESICAVIHVKLMDLEAGLTRRTHKKILSMPRRLFVTTALPYANGSFHIGHIMEYIQADIWVRFQRMQGHEVHFVCADDAHGAPIMIAADKAGKTPQDFVAAIAAGRKPYLDGFHIGFDNWHSTDGPENHELAKDIYLQLRKEGLIAV